MFIFLFLGEEKTWRAKRMNRVASLKLTLPVALILVFYSSYGFSEQQRDSSLRLTFQSAAKPAILNNYVDIVDLNQAISLYSLGLKYLHGKGVTQNYAKAVRLFKKAARQGYPRADYQLGMMYRDGVGVGRNKNAAIKRFRIAASWGEVDAKSALERLLSVTASSKNDVASLLRGSDPKVLYRRAKVFLSGNNNQQKDFKKAFRLLKKSSKLNHKESQYELALLYKNGTGTTKNVKKARQLLSKAVSNGYIKARVVLRELLVGENKNQKFKAVNGQYNFSADSAFTVAAKNGNLDAQYKLGLMYIEGEVSQRDPAEGLDWLRRAAEQDHLIAQLKLADLLYKGIQLDRDYAESARWYHKAAKQGDPTAQYILANMYKKGVGIGKNIREAHKWYRAAAKQGHAKAKDKISRL